MPIVTITSPDKANEKFKTLCKNTNVVCFYYWKQCGHCISFAPIWNKVTNQHKDNVNIVNIELEAVKVLDDKYKVQAFPTIIAYKNGKKHAEFVKERNEKNVHDFLLIYTNDQKKVKRKPKQI